MNLLDQILNWAAFLLWLNWRAMGFRPAPPARGPSLISTLKRTEPAMAARWFYLAAVLGVIGLRSFFYWHIGSQVNWTPAFDLCAITLPFRSDRPRLMVLFSVLSFALFLAIFYAWLLLISVANRSVPDVDPLQRLVRLHLGWVERWPALLKFFLPMIATVLIWMLSSPILSRMGLIPAPRSTLHLWEQALVLGLASLLVWKFFVVGALVLHLLNSYVYLGRVSWINFLSTTARNLLRPTDWLPLRLGRIDFAPGLAVVLVLLAAHFGAGWLPKIYQQLPF